MRPAASWSRTTAAISRATSAGPKVCGVGQHMGAAVQPTASACRSCSTASASPRVTTVAAPPSAGDLHGELDRTLLVRAHGEARRPAVDGLAVLGEHDLLGAVGDPLDADQHSHRSRHQRIRSFAGSNSGVASTEPTVTG